MKNSCTKGGLQYVNPTPKSEPLSRSTRTLMEVTRTAWLPEAGT